MSYRLRWIPLAFVAAALLAPMAARAQQFTVTRTFTPNRITSGQSTVEFLNSGMESPPADASPPGTSMVLLNYTVTSTSTEENLFPDYPFTLTLLVRDLTTTDPDNTATIVLKGTVGGKVSQTQDNIDIRLSGPAERSFLIGGSRYSIWDVQSTLPPLTNDTSNPGAISARVNHSPAERMDLTVTQAPVLSSPTVVDGVAYFGADDGRLYAVRTADGSVVPGFPAEAAPAGRIRSRAAVYVSNTGKAVYMTTDQGHVAKVGADGQVLWSVRPLGEGSASRSTPAVTPEGAVYVGITGAGGSRVVLLSDTDGHTVMSSPVIGGPNGAISSPAVSGGRVFVGLVYGTTGDIVVLDATTLTVLSAGVALGEGVTAPPYVMGPSMFVGTLGRNDSWRGKYYKLNSATAAPDPAFGAPDSPGAVTIGQSIWGSAFPGPDNCFYAGTSLGKVWRIDVATGAHSVFYDSGENADITGLVISKTGGVLAFGTAAGSFHQVPLVNPDAASAFVDLGPIRTTPSYDRANHRFVIGGEDNHVYSFPGL